MTSTPASLYLDALGIPYRFFEHNGPVESLEQAAAERGQRPEQVVRSILFRLAEGRAAPRPALRDLIGRAVRGQFCLALAGGPRQVSWPALRCHFNQRRLTLATPEEVLQITGYAIGAVSPFGLPQPRLAGPDRPLPVLLDRQVLAETEISLGSGRRGLALVMLSADLRRALPQAQVGDFVVPDS
jgi:prolyl-tRNA editing enzyme YbaK/EbsC (Cys-tRNA(Pro) deacylase)